MRDRDPKAEFQSEPVLPSMRHEHILVPTGLAASDRNALQLGLEMADTHGARLSFLHVLPNLDFDVSYHWLDAIDRLHRSLNRPLRVAPTNDRAKAIELVRRRMWEFLERELPGIGNRGEAVAMECRVGDVVSEIVDFSRDVDLVIMSTPPLRWWSPLLPSRAQRVLQTLKQELILVRQCDDYGADASAAIA